MSDHGPEIQIQVNLHSVFQCSWSLMKFLYEQNKESHKLNHLIESLPWAPSSLSDTPSIFDSGSLLIHFKHFFLIYQLQGCQVRHRRGHGMAIMKIEDAQVKLQFGSNLSTTTEVLIRSQPLEQFQWKVQFFPGTRLHTLVHKLSLAQWKQKWYHFTEALNKKILLDV